MGKREPTKTTTINYKPQPSFHLINQSNRTMCNAHTHTHNGYKHKQQRQRQQRLEKGFN